MSALGRASERGGRAQGTHCALPITAFFTCRLTHVLDASGQQFNC